VKAALLTEINQPLVLTDAIAPLPLQPGQVKVKVIMSGICGAQLQELRGEKGTHFPRLLGHEGCGIVEEVGPGVTKLKEGQKVVMHWRKGSGAESQSPRYIYQGKVMTSGQVTTFSTHSVCSENRLTPVPDDVPPELCALLGCGLSTALGVMENEAKLKMGESVLIVGCGGVGLNLIRVAKMMGASFVVGCDSHESKSHEAFGVGASQFYSSTTDGEWERFDVIVDTTGSFQAFQQCCPRLASSGRYILVGQPQGDTSFTISNARHLFDGEGKTIKATQGGGFSPDKDISRYVNMWRSGNMKLDGVVTHRFDFESINEAIEVVKSGNAGRVMLEMV
jgi:S-(hydroxymethyl)glutathione dehydrogenase/alcohol dehydrogenase